MIYLTYNLRPATCKYGGFPRREILLNKGKIGWCIKLCRIVELLIIYCCGILNEDKTIGYWSICPKSMSYINCQSEVFVSDKALQVLCDDNCLYKLYVILKKCQLFIKNVSSIHHNGNFHHKRKSIGGIIVSMFASSWDDDEVRFVLGQNAELDFYSASSLKQQSAGRHVAPVGLFTQNLQRLIWNKDFTLTINIWHTLGAYASITDRFIFI
jgi:hypothetical protein